MVNYRGKMYGRNEGGKRGEGGGINEEELKENVWNKKLKNKKLFKIVFSFCVLVFIPFITHPFFPRPSFLPFFTCSPLHFLYVLDNRCELIIWLFVHLIV